MNTLQTLTNSLCHYVVFLGPAVLLHWLLPADCVYFVALAGLWFVVASWLVGCDPETTVNIIALLVAPLACVYGAFLADCFGTSDPAAMVCLMFGLGLAMFVPFCLYEKQLLHFATHHRLVKDKK